MALQRRVNRTPGFPACRQAGVLINIMSLHYVYILRSLRRSNWYYVGSNSNIAQRIKDHNFGKTSSTKAYVPLEIIYVEELHREIRLISENYFSSLAVVGRRNTK
jgi:predicted GIY-YIG superfamily endonuclease